MNTAKEKEHGLESVEISCHAPDAGSVFLAGTFNAWDPSTGPMERAAEGIWRVTLQLAPGVYEYKFFVDDEWVCKPGMDELDPSLLSNSGCVPNVYGTANHTVEVVLSSLVEEKVA
jgi:1,4-alpha-glucan branching enzyme